MRALPYAVLGLLLTMLAGCNTLGAPAKSGPAASTPAPTTGSTTSANSVRGTVQAVDPQGRMITVAGGAGTAAGSTLSSGDRQVIGYDTSTVVEYRGQRSNNPQDIEVGDQVEARGERSGDRLMARTITVLSSVSDASGANPAAPATWDATVRSIDPASRTLQLTQSGRENYPVAVQYDANTRVEYQGRTYRPEDLESGDVVRVRTRMSGNQQIADQIVVTQNAGQGASGAAGAGAGDAAGAVRLRATIRNVDQASRTIQLDTISLAQGFDTGKTDGASALNYDANTVVEYQGKRYGIPNLEPGDVADFDVSRAGNGYVARRIVVVESR
jgi:hypothetical protein